MTTTGSNGHAPSRRDTFTYTEFDPDGNEVRHIVTGQPAGRNQPNGTRLLITASILLALLAVGQGAVSWAAQYGFIHAAKHATWPSAVEAVGLDIAAVIFALLGLARSRLGQRAIVERCLNAACAAGSMLMNVLAADMGSPRSVAVYLLPPLLYVAASDRLIAVMGAAGGAGETSVWRRAAAAAVFLLRLVLAPPSTARGLRQWVLAATPLPAADLAAAAPAPVVQPGAAAAPAPAPAPAPGSKTAALVDAYRVHPAYLDRSRVSQVAAELAPAAGLQTSSARTVLFRHVRQMRERAS